MSRADASPWGQETPSTGHAVPPEKHQCSRCPSSFKRPEHLKRHQRGHDGHKRFVCPTCSKRFARRYRT
ncbi:hypothetical protein GGR56DRAFT_575933 [Xylariaceae sp. FL0804]|nr:hypothetical protein GGR56DRAFT_575933 [Xylariaceae sp. FL0804]